VQVLRAAVEEIPITLIDTGSLPEGFQLVGQAAVEPAFVTVRGTPELVDSIDSVSATINLNGLRDRTVQIDAQLVARTASGNPVSVSLTPATARVTLQIEETVSQRVLPVHPYRINGSPAPGYTVTNVTVDPLVVTVTGPKAVVDNLTSVTFEPIEIPNVSITQVSTGRLVQVPNVTFDTQTVRVTITIEPLACDGPNSSCGSTRFFVAPEITNIPQGLALEVPARYTVFFTVAGPPAIIQSLSHNDFRATIDLTGATSGANQVTAAVSGPQGVTIEDVEPITVRLTAASQP
jgi:YbbR domain-containing protein